MNYTDVLERLSSKWLYLQNRQLLNLLNLLNCLKFWSSWCDIRMQWQKQPPVVFCEKGVLKNLTKFTGKHLCQSLFFNKVSGLRPATLLEKRLWHSYFPVNFVKFLRTPLPIGHLWWLLLDIADCSY